MVEKYKKVFLRLLKHYGCYKSFIYNFKRLERYILEFNVKDKSLHNFVKLSLESHLNVINNSDLFYYFLNDAFAWGKTKEGFDYWRNVADNMRMAGEFLFNNESTLQLENICDFKEILK